jgi:HJR/Mrr/RecB family endonuclease
MRGNLSHAKEHMLAPREQLFGPVPSPATSPSSNDVSRIDPTALFNDGQAVCVLAKQYEERERDFNVRVDERRNADDELSGLNRSLLMWTCWHSPYSPAIVGVFGTLLSLLLGFFFGTVHSISLGFALGVIVFCVASLVIALRSLSFEHAAQRLADLRDQIRKASVRADHANLQMTTAREARDLALARWKKAYDNYQQVVVLAELQSIKHELLNRNWKEMRGVPFENYLKQVFEMLGYEVQTTKASGDQGLDLVLKGKGRMIGVQAKGYDENRSVGNDAIQEAFTGMAHYRCHCCVVVTNSDFTKSARELAASVNCLLVSGDDIPDLIRGRHL